MSKYRFFVGLSIAILLLTSLVGAGMISDCLMIGAADSHACCAQKPEPEPMACCSEETSKEPDFDACNCFHTSDSPSDLPPAVPSGTPDVEAQADIEDEGDLNAPILFTRDADASRRAPPPSDVSVFLLDCAFLI